MMRILKEELLWLREWGAPHDVSTTLEPWIEHYNQSYLHSALAYKTPKLAE